MTNEEIVQEARKRLGQGPWDYSVGASESETTMRRNRLAFDRIAFRPRVLVDVSKTDTSTTFMGHDMRIPVLLAPVGSLQVFIPEGGAAAAKAAGSAVTRTSVVGDRSPAARSKALAADRRLPDP